MTSSSKSMAGQSSLPAVTALKMNFSKNLPSIISRSIRCLQPPVLSIVPRSFSTQISLPSDIEFDELKQKLETKEVTLIDVRLPKELTKFGMIPGSKNILVQTLGPDILLSEDEFLEKFGFDKPSLDEPIVITCLLGIRARTAQLAMMAVGYNNVRVYKGSYEDWLAKEGPVVYPEPEDSN